MIRGYHGVYDEDFTAFHDGNLPMGQRQLQIEEASPILLTMKLDPRDGNLVSYLVTNQQAQAHPLLV